MWDSNGAEPPLGENFCGLPSHRGAECVRMELVDSQGSDQFRIFYMRMQPYSIASK